MPPELIPSDDEEDYASSEDSDFAPDEAAPTNHDGDAEAASSDDESDDDNGDGDGDDPSTAVKSTPQVKGKGDSKSKPKNKKRKRVGRGHGDSEEAEDAGFENSGDEAIIEKGLKRQRRKGRKDGDDDEGGEGGVIKTRSMRAQEKVEKKPLLDTSAATIDVDSVWAAMISGKPAPTIEDDSATTKDPTATISNTQTSLSPKSAARKETRSPSTTLVDGPDSMILIKRTYNFAGKVHTEQKLVARDSAEAKLYLSTQPDTSNSKDTPEPTTDPSSPFTKPKRPPKKARRSIFEPLVEGLPQRTDLHFGSTRRDSKGIALVGITGKEKKLNTVEKSAMDWAGFVDKEGIKDELDAAGKSKGAYKARQAFLARVEDKREEEARRARGLAT